MDKEYLPVGGGRRFSQPEPGGLQLFIKQRITLQPGHEGGARDAAGCRFRHFFSRPQENLPAAVKNQGRVGKAAYDPVHTAPVPGSSHAVSTWDPLDLSLVASMTESLEPGRLSEGLAKAFLK